MPNSTRRRTFESVRRPQLVGEVIGQLRERFTSGDFEVGEAIPSESALMAELGVGRTTLREAIRVLEYAGILEVRQGSGTFVRSLSGTDSFATRLRQARVTEVFAVRRALELEIVRLAAMNRTMESLCSMRLALETMSQSMGANADMAFLEADMAMYRVLAEATKNSVLVELHANFSKALHVALAQIIAIPEIRSGCLESHQQLIAAIADQDADHAELILRSHLDQVMKMITKLLGDTRLTSISQNDMERLPVPGSKIRRCRTP